MATPMIAMALAINVMSAQQGGRGQGQGQGPGAGQGQGRGGQGRGGPGGPGGPGAAPANLPTSPTAVALPTVTAEITGPGEPYASVQSLAPGYGLAKYKYVAKEYFISGTANGQPYKTRLVVRRPANTSAFSGLVMVEPMHPSGSAHMFEYTSIYTMSSGHMAVEVVAGGLQQVIDANKERYKDLQVAGPQTNEIIAQVGALVKSKTGPFAGLAVRKMILAGTSATAGTLIQYLPAHMVYRTPDMQRIFDGFMPTSNGSQIRQIDVPMIHVPTMLEIDGQRGANLTTRPDGDAPGDQYRVYEFPGMGHIDSRDSVRLQPNPCKYPVSAFPLQAYMSVAMNYLYQWVDKGVAPPRADRIPKENNRMVLDENGNPKGGIRNVFVDVATVKYAVPNEAAATLPANPSAYIARGGPQAATQMCGLAAYQTEIPKEKLKQMYGSKQAYQKKVETRLKELEKMGWSLKLYHDFIKTDTAKAEF
jgi:hypothetical protein